MFGKPIAKIEVYRIPAKKWEDHFDGYSVTFEDYVGVYDDVDDLLCSCFIDGIPLKDTLFSDEGHVLNVG